MKILQAILLLAVSVQALSAVPYSFVSGTPAKASEVNENFTQLDTRLSELDIQVSNIQSANCSTPFSNDITWENKVKSPGETITTNGGTYHIFKLPFVEFDTGDTYHITLPGIEDSSAYKLSVQHTDNSNFCSNANIAGFSAQIFLSKESKYVSYTSVGPSTEFFVQAVQSLHIKIAIDNTIVSLSVDDNIFSNQTLDGGSLPALTYDLTSNINSNLLTHDPQVIQDYDNFVDHIFIEKAP